MKRLTNARFFGLVAWRWGSKFEQGASPRQVADSLSCEELAYEDIPKHLYEDVVAFRHCTRGRRLQIAMAVLTKKKSRRTVLK